jgi:SAM-dependent methyltransferase
VTDPEIYYEGHDLEAMAHAKNYTRWILDCFMPWLKGNICEVGAGAGGLSKEILSQAPIKTLTVYEPSPNLSSRLKTSLMSDSRCSVYATTLGGAASNIDTQFDTIIYDNVLEHIKDDTNELQTVSSRLKPGGHLLVLVPAHQWLYSEFDASIGHYRRYHKEGFLQLLDLAGLEPVKVRYMDLLGVIPWYISMVILKGGLSSRAVKLYDLIGIPISRTIESVVRPPWGKNLLVVARKPKTTIPTSQQT